MAVSISQLQLLLVGCLCFSLISFVICDEEPEQEHSPFVETPITILEVKPGKDFEVKCGIGDLGFLPVVWKKDSVYLATNMRISDQQVEQHQRLYALKNGNLKIANAQVTDTGNYSCDAGASLSTTQHVHVGENYKPDFIIIEPEPDKSNLLVIRLGEQFTLTCRGDGSPKPKYLWEISDTKTTPAVEYNDNNQNLVIREATRGHTATYTCKTSNFNGDEKKSVKISVLSSPHITKADGEIENAIVGHTVSLNCPVEGFPVPDIKWYYEGSTHMVENKTMRHIPQGDNKQNLELVSVKNSDAGSYKCIAKNSEGEASIKIELRIQYKESISSVEGEPNSAVVSLQITSLLFLLVLIHIYL